MEERNGSNVVEKELVWGATYIDELVCDYANGSFDYFVQDANWNVQGMLDIYGDIEERYEYSPYGQRMPFTANYANDFTCYEPMINSYPEYEPSGYPWGEFGFQGLQQDEESGLVYARNRYLNPTLGTWMEREPFGGAYLDGMDLYECESGNPEAYVDPWGLDSTVRTPWEDYWKKWKLEHPDLSPGQLSWAEQTLALGCIGVTAANLGKMPEYKNCFALRTEAEAKQKSVIDKKECDCKLFSVHFYSPGGPPKADADGKIDMHDWSPSSAPGRPKGAWNAPSDRNGYNFDFGWVDGDGHIWHANHFYNPKDPLTGKGKYFPDDELTEQPPPGLGNSEILMSTPDDWGRTGVDDGGTWHGYQDFNSEVWCVDCLGKFGAK